MKMWHIYILVFYKTRKKNEIMKFTEKWVDLGIILLSEVVHTQTTVPCFAHTWLLVLG